MTLTLLDDGLGQELMARSTGRPTGLWSVQVQINSPDLVQKIHHEYFLAGADVAIVGGCCEVGPAHIHELARRLKGPIPSNPF
jgi:S-methylmethionine-dependent homocysteine/selenocysteine methylase